MRSISITRFAAVGIAACTLASTALPMIASAKSVSAIKGKDEKAFVNPASRCDTPAMRKLHAQNVATMKQDVAKFGVKAGEAAVKDYAWKLDVTWEAMTEPYCGFGSRGVTAVKKSYQKSITRARGVFMELAKGVVAVAK